MEKLIKNALKSFRSEIKSELQIQSEQIAESIASRDLLTQRMMLSLIKEKVMHINKIRSEKIGDI